MRPKYLFALLITFLITSSLYSLEYDWGGTFQNKTDTSSQSDSLGLWTEFNISPLINFEASLGYKFLYDFDDESVNHIPEFAALNLFGKSNDISYKAGRFTLSDQNKNLFGTIIDGFEVDYNNRLIDISSGLGFTGLVFNKNSAVLMTSKDFTASSDDALLASPRLAEYAEISYFVLPGDGAVTAALLAQQDLRSESSIDSGEGLLHSYYLNLGLKGRLKTSLFYNFYVTGELGSYNMTADDRILTVAAAAGGLKVDVPITMPLKPLLSVDLFYSSGDDWGRGDYEGSSIDSSVSTLNQYSGFTYQTRGFVYNVGLGNLVYGDVSFTISPFSFMSVRAGSLTMFRAVDGPVSELPVSESDSSSSLFLGEEVTLALNFRPFSDLGLQLKGGAFIPNDAVVSDGVQYKVSGYLSLSF